MKIILNMLKKTFGVQLFLFAAVWFVWIGLNGYAYSFLNTGNSNIIFLWEILPFIFVLLIIWSIGCFFSIARKVFLKKEKPLNGLFSYQTIYLGYLILLRFVFICLPFISCYFTFNAFLPEKLNYIYYLSLFYVVFIISPYCLLLTKSQKMPWIKGLWRIFKQNASAGFSFVFWFSFSFVLYTYLAPFLLQFGTKFLFIHFFILFYIFFFNAVLLGTITQRIEKQQTGVEV